MNEESSNQSIVTGKICDNCNVLYGPDIEYCPKCGTKDLHNLTTTPIIQEIHKKEKKREIITAVILLMIVLGWFAFVFFAMHS